MAWRPRRDANCPKLELIDSSAWIEFLTATGSPACLRVDSLISVHGAPDAMICGPIRTEILAGGRDSRDVDLLDRLLSRAHYRRVENEDWDLSASLYRSCRAQGETVRTQLDCLIAAVAIAHAVPVLHNDRDFDVLARHTPLRATRG